VQRLKQSLAKVVFWLPEDCFGARNILRNDIALWMGKLSGSW
jgi:hypothetical protein